MQIQIDIQRMIYTALNGVISVPVFDDVPQDRKAFPYVVIGDTTFTESSSDLRSGFDVSATIHTWSRYPGSLEVKQVQAEIYNALHREPLDTNNADYGVAGVTFDFSDTTLDPDGITRHGISRFTLYAAESA